MIMSLYIPSSKEKKLGGEGGVGFYNQMSSLGCSPSSWLSNFVFLPIQMSLNLDPVWSFLVLLELVFNINIARRDHDSPS